MSGEAQFRLETLSSFTPTGTLRAAAPLILFLCDTLRHLILIPEIPDSKGPKKLIDCKWQKLRTSIR